MRDHEKTAERPETAGTSEEVFALESRGSEPPGGGPGGEKTEENAGDEAKNETKKQDLGVDADVEIDGDRNRETEGGESTGGPDGDENAECAAEERKQRAFGDDLAEKLETSGAESDADGRFALTSSSSGEEEIGNIGASNEENKEDDEHERREEEKDHCFIARRERARLFETEAEVFVDIGVSLRETLCENRYLRDGRVWTA